MDHYSILDRSVPQAGQETAATSAGETNLSIPLKEIPPEPLRFPAEDNGKSLSEMAQRDLDATLQLLAERAQYITGASGAAIALRKDGEMICRASAGPSAPELGAHLQVNSGLSGESVRTRQTLRCDNAEADPRVNRESCRMLGIASVVVVPLKREQEVNGVFELLSGRPYAFEERDLIALERLGEMIQTALEQAEAAKRAEKEILAKREAKTAAGAGREPLEPLEPEEKSAAPENADTAQAEVRVSAAEAKADAKAKLDETQSESLVAEEPGAAIPIEHGNVGKCEACGFPVSEGRKLCLDCEASGTANAVAPVFRDQVDASNRNWLRSHLYLIGSLLVVALTVAVLAWIR